MIGMAGEKVKTGAVIKIISAYSSFAIHFSNTFRRIVSSHKNKQR